MANNMLLCCLAVLCFVAVFDYSDAECCSAPCRGGYCLDCTGATPNCGYGPCNIFGCNCDGGCRRPSNPPCQLCNYYSSGDQNGLAVTDAKDVFTQLDLNGDGRVDVDETSAWLRRRGHGSVNVAEKFQALDQNQDRFLSLDEIDG